MKILVIDDDVYMRGTLCAILEDAGFEVVEAEEGGAGLEVLAGTEIDLVLTDLIMPGKEGIETICMLQADYPHIPLIAMSGGSPRGVGSYLESAATLGASRCLQKPFTPDELLAAIRDVVAERGTGATVASSPEE